MNWPDLGLPSCLVFGFPIVGDILPTGIFRPILPSERTSKDSLLGQAAVTYIDDMCSDTRPHRFARQILEVTQQEIEMGLCSPLVDRHYLDQKYGAGQWRPMPRHVVYQSGKYRPIDDGR
eukprot:8225609-Karenia_brevis.AAC.1